MSVPPMDCNGKPMNVIYGADECTDMEGMSGTLGPRENTPRARIKPKSLDSQEFEFCMCSKPKSDLLEPSMEVASADELFFQGQLLPLQHLHYLQEDPQRYHPCLRYLEEGPHQDFSCLRYRQASPYSCLQQSLHCRQKDPERENRYLHYLEEGQQEDNIVPRYPQAGPYPYLDESLHYLQKDWQTDHPFLRYSEDGSRREYPCLYGHKESLYPFLQESRKRCLYCLLENPQLDDRKSVDLSEPFSHGLTKANYSVDSLLLTQDCLGSSFNGSSWESSASNGNKDSTSSSRYSNGSSQDSCTDRRSHESMSRKNLEFRRPKKKWSWKCFFSGLGKAFKIHGHRDAEPQYSNTSKPRRAFRLLRFKMLAKNTKVGHAGASEGACKRLSSSSWAAAGASARSSICSNPSAISTPPQKRRGWQRCLRIVKSRHVARKLYGHNDEDAMADAVWFDLKTRSSCGPVVKSMGPLRCWDDAYDASKLNVGFLSCPASMRSSPHHSSLFTVVNAVPKPSFTDIHIAIQDAITHCKESHSQESF